MVSSQDLRLGGFVVGVAFFVGTAGLAASAALAALSIVLKAEADDVFAAAAVAGSGMYDHAKQFTKTAQITALPLLFVFSFCTV